MALEDLITPGSNTLLGGSNATWLDADTIRDPAYDKDIRLKGVNAPETYKGWKAGEVGGHMSTEQVRRLANELGFTEVVTDGKLDATGNRLEGDLRNPKTGRLFSQELTRSGVLDIHHDYDPGQQRLQSREYAAWLGEYQGTEWEQAKIMIDEAIDNESRYQQQFKQAQAYSGEIGNLERMLENPDLSPEDRDALQRRLGTLSEFAKAEVQLMDRDQISGAANNPWSDSWDVALLGVGEAMFGVANMLGESTGWEGAEEWGAQGVARAQAKIGDHAWAVRDWKDVEDLGSAVDFVANNAIMSLPYMGISMAGALASPFTGGLSLSAPAAVYAGQTWNEMEGDKSAAIAIGSGVAQAMLDRVGISFITKGMTGSQITQKAIAELSKEMGEAKAKETVLRASRLALAGFAGDAAKVAKSQLAAKQVFKNFASRAAAGVGGEAITEAMQEATAYMGATLGSEKQFDWAELNDRMIAGAIAGGALGGAFSTVGAAADVGGWADVAFRTAPADQQRRSQSQKYAQQERDRNGRVSSIQEEVQTAHRAATNRGTNAAPSLQERVDQDKKRRKDRTALETVTDAALAAPSLWRGATRWIFNPELQAKSRSARVLADMFGGNLQRIFSGSNFETVKQHRLAMYKNMVAIPDQVYAKLMPGNKRISNRDKARISKQVYEKLQAAIDPETKQFNPDLLPDDAQKGPLVAFANQLNALSEKMWEDQRAHNPELGHQHNYLMRYKALDKLAIKRNRYEFMQALIKKTGMSEKEAKEITDSILDSTEVHDIDDAFSVTQGGIVPGSHRARTLNLSEDPEFQAYMQQDIFANIATAAKSAARYTAHREFIGENGGVIAELLQQMEEEGVSPAEVNRVAAQMQDYLDAESGNYKRPTSEAGKNAMRIQKNFMMFTTMAGLPLATISSFVELALTMRGLTMEQITRKDGGLASMGKEFGQLLWNFTTPIASRATNRRIEQGRGTVGDATLRDLGFYEWDVGAATVTGVTEVNAWQQRWYQLFFQATGLTDWTNYTRGIRASIAGDYITDKLNDIVEYPDTNAAQEAEEALRNLGVNVDDMLNLYRKAAQGRLDEADNAQLDENLREATFNFINDAVALPGSANRPLIYQDPRFALFTQFQGFIATFTANHIPKLWGEYVKRGSPAMKYNAFAVMTTMIMLGFASQHLKDLIKYAGKSPYLDRAEYLQRGVRSSGLLGTSERILDQFFPLYETRSDNPGEWFFNETTGQSPALSNLKRLGKAGGDLLTGDVGKAAKGVAKSFPLIGPFNPIAEMAKDYGSRWNFSGE